MAVVLRRMMDRVYWLSGTIAASFLFALFVLVVIQMISRWTGYNIPGLTTVAGYFMGATSFFALAYTLKQGAHIRVSLLVQHLGVMRKRIEIISVAISFLLALLFCFYAAKTTYVSYLLHEVSLAQDVTPLWIPQLFMFIGTLFFLFAILDLLIKELTTDKDRSIIIDGEPRK